MFNDSNVGVVSLSVYDLLNDDQFKKGLELYGWSLTPATKTGGNWFYNSSSNAAFVAEQKGNLVELSARNMMTVQDEVLPPGARHISAKVDAVSFAVWLLREYSGFNVFEDSNSLDDIFGGE